MEKLQAKIMSSLKPKGDELRNMLQDRESKAAVMEFLNNEDVNKLYIYSLDEKLEAAAAAPPTGAYGKSMTFYKIVSGVKVTAQNFEQDVSYMDCTANPLEQISLLTREIYMPLLCADSPHGATQQIGIDRMMELLTRTLNLVDVGKWHSKEEIILPLPNMDVLRGVADSPEYLPAVIHSLESTVISWSKQMKGAIRHDQIKEVFSEFGPHPLPDHERFMWSRHLDRLESIQRQLSSEPHQEVVKFLSDGNSHYAVSLLSIKDEIDKLIIDTEKNLEFWNLLMNQVQLFQEASTTNEMVHLFPPIIHTAMLIWKHSSYYHECTTFQYLLTLLANEVVSRALFIVGDQILQEPLESYVNLKKAMRVCAAFRGTYLDWKNMADEINSQNIKDAEENLIKMPRKGTIFRSKMYGPHAYVPDYSTPPRATPGTAPTDEPIWSSSPWPPRNAQCFSYLNSFVERCNDVLELVQTTEHFQLLEQTTNVGGAGDHSLNMLVEDILSRYHSATAVFFEKVPNVLCLEPSNFERAFYDFRIIVRDLERKLSGIIKEAFKKCPSIQSQLRLIDVFTGVCNRDLIAKLLETERHRLLEMMIDEVQVTMEIFTSCRDNPPLLKNMPPFVSKLLWTNALKDRIQIPFNRLQVINPLTLQGDQGWALRHAFMDALKAINAFIDSETQHWESLISDELVQKLKEPLLKSDFDDEVDVRPGSISTNLDRNLITRISEITFLANGVTPIKFPPVARKFARTIDVEQLKSLANRVELVATKYNNIITSISEFEHPLFESKLAEIDDLIDKGLNEYTWRDSESHDFIQHLTSLICLDVDENLERLHAKSFQIEKIAELWSTLPLDIFSMSDYEKSYTMAELDSTQNVLNGGVLDVIVPSGKKIQALLESSLETLQISKSSPAWAEYVDFVDAIILNGLKLTVLTTLKSVFERMTDDEALPILKIRLEMINDRVLQQPPVDVNFWFKSVQEYVDQWLADVVEKRSDLVTTMGNSGTFMEYVSSDEEIEGYLDQIISLVDASCHECKTLTDPFSKFSFLWMNDIFEVFRKFLKGRSRSRSHQFAADRSASPSTLASPSNSPDFDARTTTASLDTRNAPSLEDFGAEIMKYQQTKEQVLSLPDEQQVGWIVVNMRPVKQFLAFAAMRSLWVFSKYLAEDVATRLDQFDVFITKTEPEVEAISGDETDTTSFMRLMRLFNRISAQQNEFDSSFPSIRDSVELLNRSNQELPPHTQDLYDSIPGRWSNLKTKVSLAKQKLGPRIQGQSYRIRNELIDFGKRFDKLDSDLNESDVFLNTCTTLDAFNKLAEFDKHLVTFENEAEDLSELQELLESSVVDFSQIQACRYRLTLLNDLWEIAKTIRTTHRDWKQIRWTKIDIQETADILEHQLLQIDQLDEISHNWHIWNGLHVLITSTEIALPLVDNLRNPAMRMRHWKQIVRATGTTQIFDSDFLKSMTFGQLLDLGIQKHADEIRTIIAQASRDLKMEKSLKFYEEVWLSKIFDFRRHSRIQTDYPQITGRPAAESANVANRSDTSQSEETSELSKMGSRLKSSGTPSKISRQLQFFQRRTSDMSLPTSLAQLDMAQLATPLMLLTSTDKILSDLESHQLALQIMGDSGTAGSFSDDIFKWQSRLQTIEAVLKIWLRVQDKWCLLEEVYSSSEARANLTIESSRFTVINRDFRALMKATEKNPNVLQCCSRKYISEILLRMESILEQCQESLILKISRYRNVFPRFYFLPLADIFTITCLGYDLEAVSSHLHKLIPNLNRVIYNRVDEVGDVFQIKGVSSFLDEELVFEQALILDSSIEIWLGNLLSSIKLALQNQLALAIGQKLPTHLREISAVGARKTVLSSKLKKRKSDKKAKQDAKSWILDNNGQIVDLITRIQMTDDILEATNKFKDGDADAFSKLEKNLNKIIHMLVTLLNSSKPRPGDHTGERSQSARGSEETSTIAKTKSKRDSSTFGDSSIDPSQKPEIILEGEQPEMDPLLSEAKTQEPVDTLTINAPSLRLDEELEEAEIFDDQVRLCLFPDQIHKISRILSIVLSQRELVDSLSKETIPHQKISDTFDWHSQLFFKFNDDLSTINIECMNAKIEYGFEFQGSSDANLICYHHSRTVVAMLQAIASPAPVLCSGSLGCGRLNTIQQLATVVGQACFTINCAASMNHELISNLFKGLAISGCWMILPSLYRLNDGVLESVSNILQSVYDGLRTGKQSVLMGKEEVILTPTAALFSVLHSNVRMNFDMFESKLLIPSCTHRLPSQVTNQFRPVVHKAIDKAYYLELLLTLEGFHSAKDLGYKVSNFLNFISIYFGFTRPSDMSLNVGYGWTSIIGSGMTAVKGLARKSGATLEQLNQSDSFSEDNIEDVAVVFALRDTVCLRLNKDEVDIVQVFLRDTWPNVDIPLHCLSEVAEATAVHTFAKQILTGTIIDSPTDTQQTLSTLTDAVAVATSEMSLIPCIGFQSRVMHLSELATTYQTIIVAGPVGCGKTECIKTFASAAKLLGNDIHISSIYTRAVSLESLVGYYDNRGQWRSGLIATNMQKLNSSLTSMTYGNSPMSLLLFDGEITPEQIEVVETLIHNNGEFSFANNERLRIPNEIKFLWEVESVSHLNPTILSSSGLVVMASNDVGWHALLERWLQDLPEGDRSIIRLLCNTFVEPSLVHLGHCLQPKSMRHSSCMNFPDYKSKVALNHLNAIQTLKKIMEGLVVKSANVSDDELCRYFSFSCIWAFGGFLDLESKNLFSDWWRNEFKEHDQFPRNGCVFDYCLDAESKEFVNWSESVPLYTSKPHLGIPSDTFIHTSHTIQLSYLFALLADVGRHCMLLGSTGCGKSGIVLDKIRTSMTGEVSEVLTVMIKSNNLTGVDLVHKRLSELLEWKHGQTYVPLGNKKLVCFLDDLNLVERDHLGHRVVCEMVREHIDDGGFYNPDTLEWKQINSVTYVTTVNPQTTNNVPFLQERLLRHFSVFHVPYPDGDEQFSIFKVLLRTHFIGSLTSAAVQETLKTDEALKLEQERANSLENWLDVIINITVDLKSRLAKMFLPTVSRCHYLFTMKELSTIFRNLTLTLGKDCDTDSLLLLWQHECEWVFAQKLIDKIDYERYQSGLEISQRKFIEDESKLEMLLNGERPVFGNLVERESGLVSAFDPSLSNQNKWVSDEYEPYEDFDDAQYTCAESLREYNKSNPPIALYMYRCTVEHICRMSRVILSPHNISHFFLAASGDPGRVVQLMHLVGSVTGYSLVTLTPPSKLESSPLVTDLISFYTRAGVKGEKLILIIRDRDLVQTDDLNILADFVVDAHSIRHLFSYEEKTTIINSIRTEVTQAGLEYTKTIAWQFFLDTVRRNVRMCFICATEGQKCRMICRDYPNLIHNVNFVWLGHWSKQELIDHSLLILAKLDWMKDNEKENTAHMLASMHLSLRQQDKASFSEGFGHVTNTTFDKFVDKFVAVANTRFLQIEEWKATVVKTLEHIHLESSTATKLTVQLEHEGIVLDDRVSSTDRILNQIGQDRVIAQQQERTVKQQIHRLRKLKKLLPEYQVAHERAVYKTANIVQDTQHIIKSIAMDKLAELRGSQKPGAEVEDLMAAIIMILKSPSSDLSWQKGAKRQLANLERFVDELLSFDNQQLPESTLAIAEPLLKKESFDPEHLQEVTSNPACINLCRWVHNVVRYHRMMISKVRPLYEKVQETTKSIEDAEHKSKVLEGKREAMTERLRNLSISFEDATLDKMLQMDNKNKIVNSLETAGQLKQILYGEKLRLEQVLSSLPLCQNAITGAAALAAGLCLYLGPYDHEFRYNALTVYWPNCLRERGIPLVMDSIDFLKGRVVEFTLDSVQRPSAVGVRAEDVDYMAFEGNDVKQNLEIRDQVILEEEDDIAAECKKSPSSEKRLPEDGNPEEESETFWKSSDGKQSQENKQTDFDLRPEANPDQTDSDLDRVDNIANSISKDDEVEYISAQKYKTYIRCLAKLLVNPDVVDTWASMDINTRLMENSAILTSADIRPCLILDPHNQTVNWINFVMKQLNGSNVSWLDMNSMDAQMMLNIERHFINGDTLLLNNCPHHIDNVTIPLVYHFNNIGADGSGDLNLIQFNNRRVLCHQNFKLILRSLDYTLDFCPEIASCTTILNCSLTSEPFVEYLTSRAVALMRPELHEVHQKAFDRQRKYRVALNELMTFSNDRFFVGKDDSETLWKEEDLNVVAECVHRKLQIAEKLSEAETDLQECSSLCEQFLPIARRAVMIFSIISSMKCVKPEYEVNQKTLLTIFDTALGGMSLPDTFDDLSLQTTPEATEAQLQIQPQDTLDSEEAVSKAHETESSVAKSESAATYDEEMLSALTSVSIDQIPPVPKLDKLKINCPLLSNEETATTVLQLTSNIYHTYKRCLLPADRVIFGLLMCININIDTGSDEASLEEVQLVLRGFPDTKLDLDLSHFSQTSQVPTWILPSKWSKLLTISVFPGKLDNLCVHVADNSRKWKEWYFSLQPEVENIPIEVKEDPATHLSDVQKLMLLQILRPDRFMFAADHYVYRHLSLLVDDEKHLLINHLVDLLPMYLGVLVLCPNEEAENSSIDNLMKISKEMKLDVQKVFIDASSGDELSNILTSFENGEDTWLLIENIHIVPKTMLQYVALAWEKYLAGLHNQRHASQKLVWMFTKVSQVFPDEFLRNMYPMSWDIIGKIQTAPEEEWQDMVDVVKDKADTESKSNHSVVDESVAENEHADTKSVKSNDDAISLAEEPFQQAAERHLSLKIMATLCSLPSTFWTIVNELEYPGRISIYGLAIIFGLMKAKQEFGCCAIANQEKWDIHAFYELVELLRLHPDPFDQIDNFITIICELILRNRTTNELDNHYAKVICNSVFSQISQVDGGKITVGSTSLWIPSKNIEPCQYASFFNDRSHLKYDAKLIPSYIVHASNETKSEHFLSEVKLSYDALTRNFLYLPEQLEWKIGNLKQAVEICHEKLPQFLQLDPMLNGKHDFSFSYHRPSVVNDLNVPHGFILDSIAFLLNQECLYFNNHLAHIRQNLHDLNVVVSGSFPFIPMSLQLVASRLNKLRVPSSWLAVSQQPSTHSLESWLLHMHNCYRQFEGWLRSGSIKCFDSVWLGGLANPRGLIEAYQYECALLHKSDITSLKFRCEPLDALPESPSTCLILNDCYLMNASWDRVDQCLTLARTKLLYRLPNMVLVPDTSDEAMEDQNQLPTYETPVCMNISRQQVITYLPLRCASDQIWNVTSPAVIIDPGKWHSSLVDPSISNKARSATLTTLSRSSKRISARSSNHTASSGAQADVSASAAHPDVTVQLTREPNLLETEEPETKEADAGSLVSLREFTERSRSKRIGLGATPPHRQVTISISTSSRGSRRTVHEKGDLDIKTREIYSQKPTSAHNPKQATPKKRSAKANARQPTSGRSAKVKPEETSTKTATLQLPKEKVAPSKKKLLSKKKTASEKKSPKKPPNPSAAEPNDMVSVRGATEDSEGQADDVDEHATDEDEKESTELVGLLQTIVDEGGNEDVLEGNGSEEQGDGNDEMKNGNDGDYFEDTTDKVSDAVEDAEKPTTEVDADDQVAANSECGANDESDDMEEEAEDEENSESFYSAPPKPPTPEHSASNLLEQEDAEDWESMSGRSDRKVKEFRSNSKR